MTATPIPTTAKEVHAQIAKEAKHFQKLATRPSGEESIHQLWCPSRRALALMDVPYKQDLFGYWHAGCVKEIRGKRYMVVMRDKKTRVVSLVRHYREAISTQKGEAQAFTLLHEEPGKSGSIPAIGCNVIPTLGGGRPILEDGVETRGIPTIQNRATPLGKKGLFCIHSYYQMCKNRGVTNHRFQRFIIAANPIMALDRAAITLRSLAEADPKSLARGQKALHAEIFRKFPELATAALLNLEQTLKARTNEELQTLSRSFAFSLPSIQLGGLDIKLVAEQAYGPDPRTWAVSINTRDDNATEDQNQATFTRAWELLAA